MELIPYEEFGKLRMKQLAPAREPWVHDGVEWMGGFWIEEAFHGGTALYRHEDTPDEAGGLTVDVRDLPTEGVIAILDTIHLPLRPGMSLEDVRSLLGQPENTDIFVETKGYDFTIGSRHPYLLSLIIHPKQGLVYVAVVRKDVLSKCHY